MRMVTVTPEEFLGLPPQERVQLCVSFAEQAQQIGAGLAGPQQLILITIASQWLRLAETIIANDDAPGVETTPSEDESPTASH